MDTYLPDSHDLNSDIQRWKDEETRILELLEDIEKKHGFIPSHVAEELSQTLESKLKGLQTIQDKIGHKVHQEVKGFYDKWKDEEGNLIMILHEIQNHYSYVPRDVAMELARIMGIRLARIYEVITFYNYFKLVPPGKHNISVCMGTACYLKGAQDIVGGLEQALGCKEGETTQDREFHLEVVRCIGCCGMAPAMTIDGKTYGKVLTADLPALLDNTRKTETATAV